MNSLDRSVENADAKAYVQFASSKNPDMRYLTGFNTGDPVLYVRRPGRRGTIVVPQMEKDRAIAESECDVITRGEAGYFDFLETEPDPYTAQARMIVELAGGNVLVPGDFPLILAKELERFCRVRVDRGTVEKIRAVKTEHEADIMRRCQRATDEAMHFVITMISEADSDNGELCTGGVPLTSDYLRGEMECFLLKKGFLAEDTIISCGPETSMPHCAGNGVICENEPVIIDIFPRELKTGYYADMTRTVVRGEPSPEIAGMYNAVRDGKKLAKDMIRQGITGKEVHNSVLNFFEESGYHTKTEGFIHSLGHGVGLAVHESPSLSPSGGELSCGNVVTVEPGLYYKGLGGVRLEDIGIVCSSGYECFTNYKEELRI